MSNPDQSGVSVELFTGVINLLVAIHGNRVLGPSANCLFPLLVQIEEAYKALPVRPVAKAGFANAEEASS